MLRERPQVVQLATAYDGYMGLWLRRWLNLPFVVYAHGNEVLDALSSAWPKPLLCLKTAARVLANSRFTAQLVAKSGVPPHQIEIIHPGCDVDRFQPYEPEAQLRQELLGDKAGDRVILSVGNLVARKGHDMVISAMPRLLQRMPNLVYLIVGDGPYRPHLEDLAASAGVQDRVIFAGRVADERLPEVYALSDVFIMPSREDLEACDVEGFGMVFLEASACGKPTIAGRSGGIGDAVVDGVTGLLVNPLDVEDIAAALWIILSNRDIAHQFGQQGRSRVLNEFAWTRIAERVKSILGSVAAQRPGTVRASYGGEPGQH
jgi:phosphatidylinositol alpha-1,6-mannosyltransferase